ALESHRRGTRMSVRARTSVSSSRSTLGTCSFAAACLAIAALVLVAPHCSAQALDATAMLKPATDTWPTYNADYTGRRYSTLDQINSKNIGSLTLSWVFSTRGLTLKSTPLEVNGILYFTSPDNVWAVDAKFGREIWHYEKKTEGGKIGHRGVAMYKDYLFF